MVCATVPGVGVGHAWTVTVAKLTSGPSAAATALVALCGAARSGRRSGGCPSG